MIYSIFFIDTQSDSGIPFVEYNSPDTTSQKVGSEILSKFFGHVDFTIETIKKTLSYGQNLSDTTRILLIKNMNIIIHYCSKCHTLVCSIADADDNNDKILQALITLANRFFQKHRGDLDQFRVSNQHEIFNSFQIDMENFTMRGKIGQSFPKLIVNTKTLDRLRKMAVIGERDRNVSLLCNGKRSPLIIADNLNVEYEQVTETIRKLENLDILVK